MDCCRSCSLRGNKYGAVIKWHHRCIKQEAKDEVGKWKEIKIT